MMATLGELRDLLPDARAVGTMDVAVERVHTDTRSLQAGDLFVALKGERFDAHDFLAQAASAGAVAALASRGLQLDATGRASPLPGILVPDVQGGLSELAKAWRRRHRLPVLAVTGSNGKTTVTQMVGRILTAWLGDAALVTQGNLNNHIGVPLSVLRLRPGRHRAAVFELGMNHPGEIAELAAIAQPTIALVNNAQREHLEFMHTVEAVARENGSAIAALPPDGVAVFPAADAHASVWRELAGSRRAWTFAIEGELQAPASATVVGSGVWLTDAGGGLPGWALSVRAPDGAIQTSLHLPGRHNLHNATAAAALALAAGAPPEAIAEGLRTFRAVKGRSQVVAWRRAGQSLTLVDDSYNANPDSMRAAIDVMSTLPGPRWLVLGDMGEVGAQSSEMHREVGLYAAAQGIDELWCVGQAMHHAAAACGGRARWFADAPAAIRALGERGETAPTCQSVLVKGSRFMAMERFVAALQGLGEAA